MHAVFLEDCCCSLLLDMFYDYNVQVYYTRASLQVGVCGVRSSFDGAHAFYKPKHIIRHSNIDDMKLDTCCLL